MKKKISVISIILFGLFLLYFCLVGFEDLDEFGKEIYRMDRKEWIERTLIKDMINDYNNNADDIHLKNYIMVRIKAQKVSNDFYDGCPLEQPFVIKRIKDKKAWMIQGSEKTLMRKMMNGGVMYLVLDENNGDILYIAHTQ